MPGTLIVEVLKSVTSPMTFRARKLEYSGKVASTDVALLNPNGAN